METLTAPYFWVFLLGLLAAIYVLKRQTFKTAYVQGVSHGFALGIAESIEVLVDKKLVTINDKVCVNKNELIDFLTPLATDRLIRNTTIDNY